MFKEEIWAPVFFPHGQKLLKKGKNESSEFNYQALSCEGQLWKMKYKIRLFVILLTRLKSLLLKNTKWDLLELTGVFILPVCISWPYKSAGPIKKQEQLLPWALDEIHVCVICVALINTVHLAWAALPADSNKSPPLLQLAEFIQLPEKIHLEERHH